MNPHLHVKIDWNSLKEVFVCYNNSAIKFPSGKCRKIHNNSKKVQIQIQNRKYISSDMICHDEDCVTTGHIVIQKKKSKKYSLIEKRDNFSIEKKCYIKQFENTFNKTLDEFKHTFAKKVMEIKSFPTDNLKKDYLDRKVDIFFGKDIKIGRHGWSIYPDINHSNAKLYHSDYVEIHALSSSKDYLDIRTIIELDKRNIISLLDVFNEKRLGTGNCLINTLHTLKKFYMTMNLIICCGYYDQPEKWGRMNIRRVWRYLLREDNATFSPIIRYKYFTWSDNLNRNDDNEFFGESCFKNKLEIKEVLKEIFRFLYTWEFLKDYTQEKYKIKFNLNNKIEFYSDILCPNYGY